MTAANPAPKLSWRHSWRRVWRPLLHPLLQPQLRQLVRPPAWAVVGMLALAAALAARHGLVEPAAMAQACDPQPWQPGCVVRSLVVQAFIHQRIAWAALALAIVALVWRSTGFAKAAFAIGLAALVLYSADLAAPSVLMALAVLAARGPASRDGER